MEQAELDSELRMGRDCGKSLLRAISYLEKIVAYFVCKLLYDQIGVGL